MLCLKILLEVLHRPIAHHNELYQKQHEEGLRISDLEFSGQFWSPASVGYLLCGLGKRLKLSGSQVPHW